MKRTAVFIGTCLITLFFLGQVTHATQILHRTPKQMGQISTLVVRGTVSSSESYWNEGQTKIFTRTLITVDETYKGQGPSSVPVVQLGGVVGNVRMHVHGALAWRVGEEVVVFLEPMGVNAFQVSGFSQGKFGVKRDPSTGDPFITRPVLENAEVLGTPVQSGKKMTKMPLRTFINDALSK